MTDRTRVDDGQAMPNGDNSQSRYLDAPNRQQSIAERTNSTLDIATAEISSNIRGLISVLEDLDAQIIQDAAATKQKIREHIELGQAAVEMTNQIRDEMQRLVKLRFDMEKAKVR